MMRARYGVGLVLVLAACSNNTAGMNVPITMLGPTYGSATCSVIAACYGTGVFSLVAGVSSQAACQARASAAYTNGALPRYQAAIAMGTLTYDGTQAQACVDAVNALGCAATTTRRPGACAQLFVGHVALGGACAMDEECMGDAYCSLTTACPGTCQARAASGATCTNDNGCQSGLRCGGTGTARSCVTPAGDGAACQGTTGNDCGGGFICVGGSATMAGMCHTVASVFAAASGAACNPVNGQLCQPGLSCVVTSGSNITCMAGGTANGMPCHASLPDQCVTGSYCSGTNVTAGMFAGTCAPLPTAGMPCANVTFGQRCADGNACDGAVCAAVVDNGGTCTTNADCSSGLCRSGTCAAYGYCPM
jgi:hypothetical protein